MAMPAKYPEWAVDDIINPTSGQPNVSDPDLSDPSKKLLGWDFKEYPPRQWFNYLHRLVNDWIFYVNEDLFGNALGGDVRALTVYALSSHDAFSPDMFWYSTGDTEFYANDDMDIEALNNLMLAGADVWIDSNNYLYLEGLYEVDITGGEYVLIDAGTGIGISAPSITLNGNNIDVTSGGVVHAQGTTPGFRINSGKILSDYREGSFISPPVTGPGGFTWTGDWVWRWRIQDNIIDLIVPGIVGNVTSTNGAWTFVGVPSDIMDAYSSTMQSYERSSAYAITLVPLHVGVNSYKVDLIQEGGTNPDTIYFIFDQSLQTGTANIGKMFFRYEVRD